MCHRKLMRFRCEKKRSFNHKLTAFWSSVGFQVTFFQTDEVKDKSEFRDTTQGKDNLDLAKSTAAQPCSQLLIHSKICTETPKQRDVLAKYDFTADLESASYKGIWPFCSTDFVCVHLCCIGFKQADRQDVTYSWYRFTIRGWQRQEWLPGTDNPLHPPCPFPKRTVMLRHHGNKRLLLQKCINNCGKYLWTYKLSRQALFFFAFSASSVFHYWAEEGKDPESLEVCGEKLMELQGNQQWKRLYGELQDKGISQWTGRTEGESRVKKQMADSLPIQSTTINKHKTEILSVYSGTILLTLHKTRRWKGLYSLETDFSVLKRKIKEMRDR